MCVTAQVSVFKSWGGSGCVERLVNSSGGLGGHIAATASHASALGVGFGASVGTYYDVSSASSLSELGGEFSFTEVELDIVAGGFAVVYWNSQFAGAHPFGPGSVFGAELGVALGGEVVGQYGHSYTSVSQPGWLGSLPLWAIWYASPPNTPSLIADLTTTVLRAVIKAYGGQKAC